MSLPMQPRDFLYALWLRFGLGSSGKACSSTDTTQFRVVASDGVQ